MNKRLRPYSSPLLGENSLGWGENTFLRPPPIGGCEGAFQIYARGLISFVGTSDNQGRTDSGEAVTVNQHHFALLYFTVRSHSCDRTLAPPKS